MKITSLCYHDVIAGTAFSSSGFTGTGTDIHKLDTMSFRRHLEAIEDEVMAHRTARRPGVVLELLSGATRPQGCLLTFDGGGVSSIISIAPMLEEFGWRGHFFIATDHIGTRGFLTREQIRELRNRGHVIGSHSSSQRGRIPALRAERLVNEWGVSKEILSGILGEEVTTAAIASGYYTRPMAEAASVVGLKALFTLEPRTRLERCGDCLVFGRFLVKCTLSPWLAGKLAVGSMLPCARQWTLWNARKVAFSGLSGVYPKMRKVYFSRQRPAS